MEKGIKGSGLLDREQQVQVFKGPWKNNTL